MHRQFRGELLQPCVRCLPVLPLGFTRLQPGAGVGARQGQACAGQGLVQGSSLCVQLGLQCGLLLQHGVQARLRLAFSLLQCGQLVLGLLQGVGALVGRFARLGDGLFVRLGGVQRLRQRRAVGAAAGVGCGQGVRVVPACGAGGVVTQRSAQRLPAGGVGLGGLCQLLLLGLQHVQSGVRGRQIGLLLGLLCLQCGQRLFRLRQGVLGAAGLQGGVGGNGRMVVRAAQRAGFARLQRLAVRLQAVDAQLLCQYLALAGHQFGLEAALRAQMLQRLGLLRGGGLAFLLGLLECRVLGGVLAALCSECLQLLPLVNLAVAGLPARAQRGQSGARALGRQVLGQGILRLLQCVLGLLLGLGCGAHVCFLCGELGVQAVDMFFFLASVVLQRGQLLRSCRVLCQLLAPAAQLRAQLGVRSMGAEVVLHLLLLVLQCCQGRLGLLRLLLRQGVGMVVQGVLAGLRLVQLCL